MEENSDTCREFEVMAYPTIRYFPPKYKQGDKKLGNAFETLKTDVILETLVKNITLEKNPPKTWPSFDFLSKTNKELIFDGLSDDVKYLFLYFESNQSMIGPHIILDFHKMKSISIRRIFNDTPLSQEFGLGFNSRLVVLNRGLVVVDLNIKNGTEKDRIVKAITNFLKAEGISLPLELTQKHIVTTEKTVSDVSDVIQQQQEELIRKRVKENLGTVYLADLEQVVRQALRIEVPRMPVIEGDKLIALRRLLTVLERYFPFNDNGKKFIRDLQDYVQIDDRINGSDFDAKVPELEQHYNPVFSSNRWVGCKGSKESYRGYPCGLWTLFHYLTVRAAETDISSDPLEILQAMHGYIKHYFGCTDCSLHFQQMATKNHIWNVASKEDAVLWLWAAHNEVNRRLSGDATEDPEFPKGQFPGDCDSCKKQQGNAHGHQIIGEVIWDKAEVYNFLKERNSPGNIDLLGVESESSIPKFMAQISANHHFGNTFSDLDIRMGALLYMFCVCMMVIAVKLFLKKGYRKKLYVHDLLGKV